MHPTIKISIITVVYNDEKNISETIKSVLGQDYSNLEYIIVDGASTDSTLKIINEFIALNKKIKCISEKDNGIYDAMNKGIEIASGDYLYFLNSGDTFVHDRVISMLFEHINENQYDIVFGNVVDNYYFKKVHVNYKYIKLNDNFFLRGFGICHQAIFAKGKILKELKFNTDYSICADRDWLIRCYKKKYSISYIDLDICSYDRYGISSDGESRKKMSEEVKKILINNFKFRAILIYLLRNLKNQIVYGGR